MNVVTLANNHLMDFRTPGTNRTVDMVKKYSIKYSGVVYGQHYAKQVGVMNGEWELWNPAVIMSKNGQSHCI